MLFFNIFHTDAKRKFVYQPRIKLLFSMFNKIITNSTLPSIERYIGIHREFPLRRRFFTSQRSARHNATPSPACAQFNLTAVSRVCLILKANARQEEVEPEAINIRFNLVEETHRQKKYPLLKE